MKNIINLLSLNIQWIIRIPLAITFLVHGYPKLGVSVANLGYIGYLVGPFEFFGALLLLTGPFIKSNMVSRIGALMISVIMIGAIYMHLIKWNDTIADVEWQVLLLCVSLLFLVRGNKV